MSYRRSDRPRDMEVMEITPVLVGGDPNDLKNKVWLTRQQHFEVVRYWNRLLSDMRVGTVRVEKVKNAQPSEEAE